MHLSVRDHDLLWSRRITSLKMENVEKHLKSIQIRPVNLPFIQEEMTIR